MTHASRYLRAVALLAAGLAYIPARAVDPGTLPLAGCNLQWASFAWESPSLPFTNIVKFGSGWFGNPSFPRDPQGWPTDLQGQTARMLLLGEVPYPSGPGEAYTVRWEGEGTFEIRYPGGSFNVDTSSLTSPQSFTLPANTFGDWELVLTSSETSDHLRNIRIYLPGYDDGSGTWTDHFKEFYSNFDIIRFSWGTGVNSESSSFIVDWEDRRRPDYLTYGFDYFTHPTEGWSEIMEDKGVPYEVMVELCNELDIDLWVCVPHHISDDYIDQAATLFRDQLEPGRRVWLELSNEVWNTVFPAYPDFERIAESTPENDTVMQIYGQRALNLFQRFEAIYAATGERHRLINVLAGQAGWSLPLREAIGAINDLNGMESVDVFAIAPYFGLDDEADPPALELILSGEDPNDHGPESPIWEEIEGVLMAEVVRTFSDEGGRFATGPENRRMVQIAAQYDKTLVSYEGGQHLSTFFGPYGSWLGPWVGPINRHPMMQRLYEAYMQGWSEIGGSTFLFFADFFIANDEESFGFKETWDQPNIDAPKFFWYLGWRPDRLGERLSVTDVRLSGSTVDVDLELVANGALPERYDVLAGSDLGALSGSGAVTVSFTADETQAARKRGTATVPVLPGGGSTFLRLRVSSSD